MDNAKAKTTDRKTASNSSHALARQRGAVIHQAAVAALATPFNADGVVERPSIVYDRPLADGDLVDATFLAHQVDGKWIARVVWSLNRDTCEGFYGLPYCKQDRCSTSLTALDQAGKVFFEQIGAILGDQTVQPEWVAELTKLRTWLADVRHDLCKTTTDLPLAGRTTIELFAGTAVASLALQSQGATPLLVVEKDEHALATCQRNLRPLHVHRDILKLDGAGWKCDFLIAGAVCTAHSSAGKGAGLDDPGVNAVHAAAMDVVSRIDFKAAIVECAPELLEPRFKADRLRWLSALAKRGCTVRFRVVDAADFNVPQSRRRCFMVATRCELNVDSLLGFVFPQAVNHTARVEDILERHVSEDQHLSRIDPAEVVWHTKHRRSRTGLRELGRIGGKKSQGYRVYDPKAPVGPTLTAQGGGRARCTGAYLIDGKVRGLTPREACRMQGLPEWFAPDPHTGRALKQAGNALAYPLFYALGEQLAGALNRRT